MDQADWGQHTRQVSAFFESVGMTTSAVAASLTMLLGLIFALVGRRLARSLTRRSARVLSGRGQPEDAERTARLEGFVGSTVYWSALVFAGLAASELLGVPVVRGWLSKVAGYLPRLVASALIMAVGTLLARGGRRLAQKAAGSAGIFGAARVARVAELAILATSALVAIEQLGIEISFIKTTILILLAAMLFGAALAFGLGGRELVANVLSVHYLQRSYQVGQTIRTEGLEGRIVRITEIAVVIETPEGETTVPACELTRSRSTLVLRGGAR
ncbi:MAG: mechanosensitive ion channel [Myxococcales bacterium]|nr:mechanosensitive ion channel [Myxococcales bacterium]